jgi:hypothetical protein
MKIPAAAESAAVGARGGSAPARASKKEAQVASARRHNPLLDLLDEAGVESAPKGPVCDNCAAPLAPNAVICIECGYNMATGVKMKTAVLGDIDEVDNESDLSDGEKRLRKAERELEDAPFESSDVDFGDGSESVLIALLAGFLMLVLVGIGVFIILFMDRFLEATGFTPAQISVFMSAFIYIACAASLAIVAYTGNSKQGNLCVATLGLYGIMFGFKQGKTQMVLAAVMIAAILIFVVSLLIALGGNNKMDTGVSWAQDITINRVDA